MTTIESTSATTRRGRSDSSRSASARTVTTLQRAGASSSTASSSAVPCPLAGAAGAWLFRVALDAVLLFLAARHLSVLSPGLLRHARLPQTGVLLAVAATAAGAAAAGAASLPWRLFLVAIGTLAAAGTVWRLGLNQADRAEVLRFLRLTSA